MKSGAELIALERARQKSHEGYTDDFDDLHTDCQLLLAAIAYANCEPSKEIVLKEVTNGEIVYKDPWPQGMVGLKDWKKFDQRDLFTPINRLVVAGALIAAEIDRRMRAVAKLELKGKKGPVKISFPQKSFINHLTLP